MNIFSKILLTMLFFFSTASASYLTLDNGYRWDRISQRATLGGRTISVKGSTQILKKINSYQLGVSGQWDCLEYLFIRGEGHYGWICEGKYSEGGFNGNTKGHTRDYSGSIGCYFCMASCVHVAPIIGWSYDAFHVKGTGLSTADNGIKYKNLSDLKVNQRFTGPFAGFDLVYQLNPFDFTFGYEFHVARWHGDRLIQGLEYGNPPFGLTTGFSNTRHIKRVYGQVFKLDTRCQFCGCWTGGLELKYQFYTGDFGKYKRTKTPLIPQFNYANVDGLWWRSFAAMISIGRVF